MSVYIHAPTVWLHLAPPFSPLWVLLEHKYSFQPKVVNMTKFHQFDDLPLIDPFRSRPLYRRLVELFSLKIKTGKHFAPFCDFNLWLNTMYMYIGIYEKVV